MSEFVYVKLEDFKYIQPAQNKLKGNRGNDYVSYKEAIEEVLRRFIPSSLSLLVEYFVMFFNYIFVGRLNNQYLLSGLGLGNSTINIVAASIQIGIVGGIDTLVSQAYGRKEYYL